MLNPTFRKCGHSSALLNVDSTFEFLECTESVSIFVDPVTGGVFLKFV